MQEIPYSNQATVTNNDFFSHLKLPGQAGRVFAAALTAGDENAAIAAVANHFRTRSRPRWPYYMHGTAWMEIDGRGSVIEKADALMHNRFRNSWPAFQWSDLGDAGGNVDWQRGWKEMGTSTSRVSYITELSTAFALTGNTAYLKKGLELTRSQVDRMPFVLEAGFHDDHDRYFGGEAHNCLATFYRLLRWMDFSHCGAFQIPGLFSDEDLVWFLRQIWFITMQHYRLIGDIDRQDNHHLVSHGHCPFAMGVMFPEFSVAPKLIAAGKRVIDLHFSRNILADGGYVEHSTKYQYHVLYHYLNPLAVSRANGIKLFSDAQIKRLNRWVMLSVNACKPDGILAEIGDEYGGSLAFLFGSLATPAMTPELAACARALGYEPGKLIYQSSAALNRLFTQPGCDPAAPSRVGLSPYYDVDKTSKPPSAGALPKPASAQYPIGGYTFFRDDWSAGADYLAVSHVVHPYQGHSHWDPMSFILHSQGKTLIGDPATWIYDDDKKFWNRQREYRGYHYNMESHNCLIMDDDNMKSLKAMCHRCYWGGPSPRHGLGLFKAGGPIEVAEIWHDGYAPTRHRRFIVHVTGVGFILVDLLGRKTPDPKPRQYSQLLHFEAGVEVDSQNPQPGQALRASAGNAACLVIPGPETHSTWKVWRDPYLEETYGVSIGRPSPWVAELTRHIQGRAVYANFLITRAAAAGATLLASYLGPAPALADHPQHDGYCATSLNLGDQGTLLVASTPYGKPIRLPQLQTDGELAVALLDSGGQVTAWALARGSLLIVNDKSIVKGNKHDWQSG